MTSSRNARLRLKALGAALLSGMMFSGLAQAQTDKAPIRLLVPWATGGATDQIARVLAPPLGEKLGVQVIVDNRGGAGGLLGTRDFVRNKPNGVSLLLATSSTNAASPHLTKQLGFDPIKDFTPVVLLASVPNIMVVPAKSRWTSLKELIDDAKRSPGKFTYGSAGPGSSQHLAGALFKNTANVDVLHVPYKGSGPAAVDLIAGHIDMMIDTGSLGHVRGGTLRPLAVAANARLAALPQVPTFREAGLPMVASAWYGVMLPANAPEDLVKRLNTALNEVMAQPDVRERLQAIGAEIAGGTAKEFASFVQSELQRYEQLVRLSGAPKE